MKIILSSKNEERRSNQPLPSSDDRRVPCPERCKGRSSGAGLFAGFVEDLAEAVAYDHIFAGLQGHGDDGDSIRARRAMHFAAAGHAFVDSAYKAGIIVGEHLDARLPVAQLLGTLIYRKAPLSLVPGNAEGGIA